MDKCIYKNQEWLIYRTIEDAYILLKEIDRNGYAIQYKRTIANKSEISII